MLTFLVPEKLEHRIYTTLQKRYYKIFVSLEYDKIQAKIIFITEA